MASHLTLGGDAFVPERANPDRIANARTRLEPQSHLLKIPVEDLTDFPTSTTLP